MKQLTKHQIIDETVEFYSNNPRSLDDNKINCVYYNETTNTKCAFSRCCTDERVNTLHTVHEGVTVYSLDVDKILKEEYKGHDNIFWHQIQKLHDGIENWNTENNTLSLLGGKKLQELKEMYK